MRRARTTGVALAAALLLSGCGYGMYSPVTEQGKDISNLYNVLLVAATDPAGLVALDPVIVARRIGLELTPALLGTEIDLLPFKGGAARGTLGVNRHTADRILDLMHYDSWWLPPVTFRARRAATVSWVT